MRPKVLIVGGEDVHARIDLMRGLADTCAPSAAGTAPDLAPIFAQAGLPYHCYAMSRGLAPFSDLVAIAALWRLMRRVRPQIVHAFDTKPGVYACLAGRLAGVPVVIGTVTGLGSLYGEDGNACPSSLPGWSMGTRGVYEGLQRLASHLADLTIFQNRDDRKEFVTRRIVPASKSCLVHGSGVRTDVFDPARISEQEKRQLRESLGVPTDAVLVTMISRVIRSKGVEEFLGVARTVRKRVPKAHFLLVGAADRDSVDSFSATELAEFGRVVNWPGPRRDVAHILAASDLFVLPTFLREGIPRVLLEAASMGLPLITTNSPGCNEVVEEGVNGLLVPARNAAALTQAVLHLVGQPEVRRQFGLISRQRAVERFDLAVVVQHTGRLYAELLAAETGGALVRGRRGKSRRPRTKRGLSAAL